MQLKGSLLAWKRIRAGRYESQSGKWLIERTGRGWRLYRKGELWGEWDNTHGHKDYQPFRSRADALAHIDDYEVRGL